MVLSLVVVLSSAVRALLHKYASVNRGSFPPSPRPPYPASSPSASLRFHAACRRAASMTSVAFTLGPLLIGGSIALILSGMVSVQSIVFYKLYPNEQRVWVAMVLAVWTLDTLHSAFIVTSLFDYFIQWFGDVARTDFIPWSIALTVVLTAITTLIAHVYYAQKIFKSSGRNWWITAPVIILVFLRLFAASVSTYEMIIIHRFSAFNEMYPGWVFTTGLSLSAGVDIIITFLLCYFLYKLKSRTGTSNPMAQVVNILTLYTLENGLLTSLTVTASLICWLMMPNNLVFLGLHFVIGKLYANSLLISLNTRKALREMRWASAGADWDPALPDDRDSGGGAMLFRNKRPRSSGSASGPYPFPQMKPHSAPLPLQVTIQRTVAHSSDDLTDVLHEMHQDGCGYGQRYVWAGSGRAGARSPLGVCPVGAGSPPGDVNLDHLRSLP
ncbi:hypothetical protein MKEN_00573100 [Mycena kentingensis (nom. inval.)]|nr:hypothetical protein MKEN_00573100 [Mycena kentingensis (nom. inval.)]